MNGQQLKDGDAVHLAVHGNHVRVSDEERLYVFVRRAAEGRGKAVGVFVRLVARARPQGGDDSFPNVVRRVRVALQVVVRGELEERGGRVGRVLGECV